MADVSWKLVSFYLVLPYVTSFTGRNIRRRRLHRFETRCKTDLLTYYNTYTAHGFLKLLFGGKKWFWENFNFLDFRRNVNYSRPSDNNYSENYALPLFSKLHYLYECACACATIYIVVVSLYVVTDA